MAERAREARLFSTTRGFPDPNPPRQAEEGVRRWFDGIARCVKIARMSWENEIDELRRRQALAREMGGPEKVKRQHDAGKLTVRERIDRLLDPGSFHEIGGVAGKATYAAAAASKASSRRTRSSAAAASTGARSSPAATISPCAAAPPTPRSTKNRCMAEQMANELRLPIVRLIEGSGGGGSVKSIELRGHSYIPANPGWDWVVANMGTVPDGGAGARARSRGWARRGSPRAITRSWSKASRRCSSPARLSWRRSARTSPRRNSAVPTSTPAPAPSTTSSAARKRLLRMRAASSPTCPLPFTSCRRAAPSRTTPRAARTR